ncbi:hypothetical protein L593_14120 [Salinarchaeum sp. Harcht-Bsk1]|uniref:hypothetical protein n=1 Tax=Salinarchaeum sp. Harcht-Bsk1 TaxID=1333523 RepID=UPI0003424235|nr:hypothetical protein [Salinarchaeum sp. Harcht-Bsk1]AGN02763.1 hypothetical protein L593_14120 [Salinarchaeum sp. Harcht-Bsk1]
MARSRPVAAAIGAVGLVLGWAFLQAMTPRTMPDTQPYVETMSFALSTPAGLVFLTYLTAVFDFETYYGERGWPGLFGDFFLTVLTAAAVGIPATAIVVEVTTARQVLFVVSSFATFVGGFGFFYLRTRRYFVWETDGGD